MTERSRHFLFSDLVYLVDTCIDLFVKTPVNCIVVTTSDIDFHCTQLYEN